MNNSLMYTILNQGSVNLINFCAFESFFCFCQFSLYLH
uniref:Uncharacterized protein n=1 Tax=Lepeophtheirus salmonis TaxID=72036 RepID=A0A0K2UUB6_LEPSM